VKEKKPGSRSKRIRRYFGRAAEQTALVGEAGFNGRQSREARIVNALIVVRGWKFAIVSGSQ
jgi:hypothetical protein